MSLMAGTKLGPYEVVGPIGAGGMGEVYRARDLRLSREVAIKVLPTSFADHPDRLARFEAEARAVGQLNHPNVLTVFDVGSHEGAPYLVMELLEGATLRERLTDGLPGSRKALEWASQIALGLAAAHDKGIIHRDLKPENVFITRDGRVKLLDFGLARMVQTGESGATAVTTLQATEPGMVLGTVGYMSPEQVRGQPADARSDLFAVGATLYEMLTGTRAFQRESPAETMAAILKEEPPDLTVSGPPVMPAAERIVRRCLEKQPAERFQSARDLAFALDAIGGSTASRSAPVVAEPATKPRRPLGWVLGAGAVVAALGGGYLLGHRGQGVVVSPFTLRQLTFEADNAREPALSPDATEFVFVSDRAAGDDDIYLQRVGGDNPINLTKDSKTDNSMPAFSPDGRQIAFRSSRGGGGLFVMGATGESVRRVTDGGYNPAWTPDGTALVYSTEGIENPFGRSFTAQLWKVDVATGAKSKLFDGDAVQPSVSPDGHRIAFWGLPAGSGHRAIYTLPLTGGTPAVVLDDANYNWSPKWAPDGRAIYFASTRVRPMGIWQIAIDPASGRPMADPVLVTSGTETYLGLSEAGAGGFVLPSTTSTVTVERVGIDARAARFVGHVETLFRTSRALSYFHPSPDGQLFAMTVDDTTEDLMVGKADGTGTTRLTNDVFRDRGPVWAPDATRLYFYSDRSGAYEIWTIRADGSGLEQLTHHPGHEIYAQPRASPNGKLLTFYNADKVGLLDLGSRQVQWLEMPPDRIFFPVAWSPDSSTVAGSWASGNGTVVYTLATKTARLVPKVQPVALLDDHTFLGLVGMRLVAADALTGSLREGDSLGTNVTDVELVAGDGRSLSLVATDTVAHVWLMTAGAGSPRK